METLQPEAGQEAEVDATPPAVTPDPAEAPPAELPSALDALDNLLDATLDDLEDLPEFTPFKPGAHKVTASFEEKEINDKQSVELSFVLIETLELADSQEEKDAPGHISSIAFMLDNEYGRGNLKKCAVPFGEALGLSTIREIVEGVKDVECLILTTVRKDKQDPDRLYLNVKEIQIT